MDDIKPFAKNDKELETQIQAVRVYSYDIRMEFGIEKCTMLIMKTGKRQMKEEIELANQEKKVQRSEKRKLITTWECYIVIYSIMQHYNDAIIDRRTMIKTQQ